MINYITIGGITIDDIVTPRNQFAIGEAGGNSLYSAAGARLWTEDGIGIVACRGSDYPEANLNRLTEAGLDVSGITKTDLPNKRLWVLYKKDGDRQMVFTSKAGESDISLDPVPEQIPQSYLNAKSSHLSATGYNAQQNMARFLHQQNIPFSYDITQASITSYRSDFNVNDSFAINHCDYLMPSIEEFELIWGQKPSLSLMKKLTQEGPKIICVKMGSKGSLVYNAQRDQTYRIPIVPVNAVDSTGAGDAYCGGFMAGYGETQDALEAAVRGTVSASFAIEEFGLMHLLDIDKKDALNRMSTQRKQVDTVTGSY
jgi:sugar/nucleoside kinase (ribokinase family)